MRHTDPLPEFPQDLRSSYHRLVRETTGMYEREQKNKFCII